MQALLYLLQDNIKDAVDCPATNEHFDLDSISISIRKNNTVA